MILEESYRLNNGVEIPKLALGTWLIDDDKVADAVRSAVEIGYRHVDSAQAYGNEEDMAAFAALDDGSFPRIFDHHDPKMIAWLVNERIRKADPSGAALY